VSTLPSRPPRLLLGSGGFRTEERRAFLVGEMRAHFGPIRRLLFVPFALADHQRYAELMAERGFDAGYELDGLHRHPDPERAIREAEGIYIGGGNSFRLLDALQRQGLLGPIRERVAEGLPYLGVSAGANVACPTIQTTNDMPIVEPESFQALCLVPFQINPHYFEGPIHYLVDGRLQEHFGETRDDRIREFHEENDVPVVGIVEGALLRVHGGEITLAGGEARLFRRGEEPVCLEPGMRLDPWLSEQRSASL
jgi:dipeptidase E